MAVDNGGDGGVGWGSCVTCAGGDPDGTASIASSPFITSPSVDGASRDFYINGSAYTNGLWWYKVGINDRASHFKMDFWLNVTSDTQYAQALEFDVFQLNKQITQFATGTEFMFGTQCNYAAGVWDVWDASITNGRIPALPANGSSPTPGTTLRLTSIAAPRTITSTMTPLRSRNSTAAASWSVTRHTTGTLFSLGSLPAGWGEDMGLQFQMDIANAGASMTEYVDGVTLTAW